MPFPPKEWKNLKAGGTKLNAEALIDLEKRVTDYADSQDGAEKVAREAGDALCELLSNKDTDSTLAANSNTKYPSQKAVKAYVDSLLAASDAVVYKGAIDCSTNPNYPAASAGHLYVVSVAGKIGGASGTEVEAGDFLVCKIDGSVKGTQAAVGANWNVIQTNLVGAVTGPTSSTSESITIFNGTSGQLVKDSGKTFSTDNTLAGNSDALVPTQKAIKGFVETGDGLLIPKSLVDAKGDLLVGTADNTVARLGVGSNGQVLTADSAQSAGMKWATPEASSGGGPLAARFATAAALAANTRTSNVLEANANGALSIDGGSPAENDLVLVKNEVTGANNGLFKVLTPGAAGAKWKLERATTMDASAEAVPGMLFTIAEGTVNADSTWQLTTNATITINTTALSFAPLRNAAIGCAVILTSQKEVPKSESFYIPWDSDTGARCYNVGGCWSEANKTRFTAPITGLYFAACNIWFDAESSTGERALHCVLESGSKRKFFGHNHALNATNGRVLDASGSIRLTAGEWISWELFQDSGATRKIEKDGWESAFTAARATFEFIR
jgi:hypothetical protein